MLDALNITDGPGPEAIVTVSLRGTRFDVPRNAADHLPGSTIHRALHNCLSPRPPLDSLGAIFFNRNPTLFHSVLDVLVDPDDPPQFATAHEREAFERELLFWGVSAKRRMRGDIAALDGLQPHQMRPAQPRPRETAQVIPPRVTTRGTAENDALFNFPMYGAAGQQQQQGYQNTVSGDDLVSIDPHPHARPSGRHRPGIGFDAA